jgi:glycosyltransferase involved in cell wall biosynthesis
MADRGLDVHLLTDRDSHVEQQAKAAGLSVFGLPFFHAGRLSPRLWRDVARLTRRLAPSLIHAHGARGALPIAASRVGFGKPASAFVYTVHGYHFLAKSKVARNLAARAERFCAKAADRTIFVCHHDRTIAERWRLLPSSREADVIYNGIEAADLPLCRPAKRFTAAFLGRLTAQKDPLLLADVMDRLRDLPVDLRVIGDGDLRGELERRVEAMGLSERIAITGELSRGDALQALAQCRAMILPSRWEGLPIAVLEAMAIGVVAVASRVGGLVEMIEPGETGWLMEPGDADGFANAVRSLALGEGLAAGMAAKARARVLDRFAWSRALEGHLALYQRLIDAR